MTKLKYNSEAVVGVTKDFKDIPIQGYYEIGELRYILEVDTETATESGLVVGIETLLNTIFIAL